MKEVKFNYLKLRRRSKTFLHSVNSIEYNFTCYINIALKIFNYQRSGLSLGCITVGFSLFHRGIKDWRKAGGSKGRKEVEGCALSFTAALWVPLMDSLAVFNIAKVLGQKPTKLWITLRPVRRYSSSGTGQVNVTIFSTLFSRIYQTFILQYFSKI